MSSLNISSREKLDMDVNESVANHRNVFKSETQMHTKQSGILIKKWIIVIVLMIAIALVVGLSIFIAFNRFDCACDNSTNIVPNCISDANQSTNQLISTLETSNRSYVRLPTNVNPNHYDVYLQTYIGPKHFYFDGNVTINLNCTGNTFNITLHINDLIIYNDSVSLLDESETALPYISNVTYNNKLQFFIVNLNTELKSGKNYLLKLKFKGNLNDDLVGFYRSSYKDVNGNKRWLAVTQFQPTDARRAFPCFDEPAMKATFSITLIHYRNMTAISNMPLVKKVDKEDWVSDTFEQTVKMSTYLLAFLVSDFEYLTDKSANFSVWSRPGTIHTANYSLNVGPKMLRFYEDYFNVSYPLPKTDMVAVPDFNAGAMENWGLIVYRETAMLFDPTVSSDSNMQRVATVVAHELAHQWFGNLVTPKWWDDLWLNEGFASYMEYEGVHAVHPTWQMFQQFVVDEIHNVFELDCLTTSHPISVEVRNPEEINEIFDRISYGKGASIIRMMTFFLGRQTFRKGVSNYLNAFRYDNAVQNDLWNYLTLAANSSVNVKVVMDSWTLQDGYPVVTLIRHYSDRKASLTQKRFLLSTANESTEIDTTKYSWEIPITYTDSRNAIWEPITKLWMHRSDPIIALPDQHVPDRNHWIIVNLQEVGYYRVNYDTDNWKLIIRQLVEDHTLIHTINRAQIIDDSLDLAQAHLLDYHIALNTTEYLINENQFVPWEAALNAFSFLDRMLRRHSAYGMWKDYVLELISKLYLKVGWDVSEGHEDILDKYSQLNIIGWACKYAHQHCIQQSLIRFKQWQQSNQTNTIHPNLRNVVYCIGIEYGVEKDWDFVWNQYVTEQLASEKDKLLRALSCSREPWLLSRYITRAFNGSSGIRKQDGSYVFKSVAANNFGRNIAFDFLREKWDLILKYYGKSFFSFGTLIKAVTSSLNTEFELKQLQEFYNQVKDNVGTAQRTFKQALEQTKANVEWMQNNYQEIENWLQKRQSRKGR